MKHELSFSLFGAPSYRYARRIVRKHLGYTPENIVEQAIADAMTAERIKELPRGPYKPVWKSL